MIVIGSGKFVDTNVAFDAVYLNRKRHKLGIKFTSKYLTGELKMCFSVSTEAASILAQSCALLSVKVRDTLKHIYNTGKNWDSMDVQTRAKILVDMENNLVLDKEIIRKNRTEFVHDAIFKLSNTLIDMSFDEIQETLSQLANDVTQIVMQKIHTLFPIVTFKKGFTEPNEIKKEIEASSISNVFNENGHGQDKDILIELMLILALGTESESYDKLEFYSSDASFCSLFDKYKNIEMSLTKANNSHIPASLSNLVFIDPYANG